MKTKFFPHFIYLKFWLVLVTCSWLSLGTAHPHTHPCPLIHPTSLKGQSSAHTPPARAPVQLIPPYFASLEVSGFIQVKLVTGKPKRFVEVIAPPEILKQMRIWVEDGVLNVTGPAYRERPGPITVRVCVPTLLNEIVLKNGASLQGKKLSGRHLDLTLEGGSNAHLNTLHLFSLTLHNNSLGCSTIEGIHAHKVKVMTNAGDPRDPYKGTDFWDEKNPTGKLFLSGHTNQLEAKLTGCCTVLDAHRLPAHSVYVYTNGNTTAYVAAIHRLYAFAHQQSQIYDYCCSRHDSVRDTYSSGNVLRISQ